MTSSVTRPETVVAPLPSTYRIDVYRTRTTFKTRHLFGLPVHGSFALSEGEVHIADPLAESSARATI